MDPFELSADNKIYKSLIEQLPAITYVATLDALSTTIYVSPQIETILGISRLSYVSDPLMWLKLIHPDDRTRVLDDVKLSHSTGSFVSEYRMIASDGRIVWFRDEAVIVSDDKGEPVHLQGVMLDITREKIAQKQALESSQRNEKILAGAPIGISIYNSDGMIVTANRSVATIIGADLSDVLKQNFRKIDSWEKSGLLDAAEDTLASGRENRVTVDVSTTFGKEITIECRFARIATADGCHLLLLTNDITLLRQTERELRAHRDHLEEKVLERTAELTVLNKRLQHEIDQRRIAEQSQELFHKNLIKTQESLRGLLDAIHETAFLMDLDGTVLAINETAARRLGYETKDLLGRNLYDLIAPELGEQRRKKVDEIVLSGKPSQFEDVRSGRIIDQRVSPVFHTDGTVKGIAVFAMDITERRQGEIAVVESEDLFRSTFDQAAVGMAHASLEGKFLRFNEKLCSILGYSRDQMEKLTIQEITHPDDMAEDLENMNRLLAGKIENFSMEKRHICADGSAGWANVTVSLRRHQDGSPNYFIGVVQDISRRKAIEQDLNQREKFLESIFSSIQDGLSILDQDLNIIRVNPAMEKWYAHAMPLDGKKCYEAYHGRDKPCEVCPTCRALDSGNAEFEEVPLTGPGGIVHGWLELFAFPMFNSESGELVGAIEFVRDISARRKAEKESLEYKNHLERLNEELERFAYVASHDLREPLRKVTGFSELLENRYRGKLDEKADKYLYYIIDGSQRMQRLIEDLLTYSRLGRSTHEHEIINTYELAQNVLSDLSRLVDENLASVKIHELPDVIGHPSQIRQLFQNIVANAIKFRRDVAPQIEIWCDQKGDEAIFAIRDNGIGIDSGQFERIFGIFQRLHSREAYPGTGIGLAICKKIVELHGGRLWVESEPGSGSVFRFSLRLAHPDQKRD